MNVSAKNICCHNLNKLRRPFPQCCWYPLLVIWRWQFELCVEKCNHDLSSTTSASYRCCVLPCCFTYLKVIGAYPERDGIRKDGLVFSFFLSVNNDTRWVFCLKNVLLMKLGYWSCCEIDAVRITQMVWVHILW